MIFDLVIRHLVVTIVFISRRMVISLHKFRLTSFYLTFTQIQTPSILAVVSVEQLFLGIKALLTNINHLNLAEITAMLIKPDGAVILTKIGERCQISYNHGIPRFTTCGYVSTYEGMTHYCEPLQALPSLVPFRLDVTMSSIWIRTLTSSSDVNFEITGSIFEIVARNLVH
ncbi:hypothetical protein EG68_01808 [Paragonimus skrjabini miyazakii]|uniref:Uncharacterized protein n=1 Tax=Paragonimus skrjabini miyazakii TaxID=59628 RepID=A0A8S9ZBD6_9TREM|nr:hypothetical protein EG68_01808 [Paragonimus skrjabini miyazakii]